MITLDKVSVEFSKILNEVKKKKPQKKASENGRKSYYWQSKKINNFFILGIKESTPKFFSVFF